MPARRSGRSEALSGRELRPGKIPIDVLRSTVLRMTGAPSKYLDTPPRAGLDFAAIRVGRKSMLVSADPVTGVVEDIGTYAVNVNANDVATSGNRPQFMESLILLPPRTTEDYLERLARQVHEAAAGLGISIVGGHTEVTPGLIRPIVAATAFSFVDRYISSGDAKAGSTIMMSKTAGLEGTAILTKSRELLSQLSVVEEAVAAFESGGALAMHDCTEGGVLGAAYEMSVASGVGFEVEEASVPVAPVTRKACDSRSVDPMKLIGSGSLLIAVRRGSEEKVSRALGGICEVTAIGKFTRRSRTLVRLDGTREKVDAAPEDELWRLLDLGSTGGDMLSPSL